MRAVVQRVREARVEVEGCVTGQIGRGLVALIGVAHTDTLADARFIAEKIAHLRIFADAEGRMNLSARDVGAAALVISQFTLLGDARKGRRPSYAAAAPPEVAEPLYQACCQALREQGVPVATGVFGAYMQITLVADGPVTILLDSQRVF
ncbi:MAG: D-tyrosyl-tRNA(Tyr) deacylase [Armatimonadetes bacterium]|nr:D-tyrosyl-tRNA(Tyr) deacylase [Armatimonadota bacterium]